MQQVSVGLSLHRPEMIPLISEAMRRSEAIFLEEPPAPGFDQMIRGELSVEEYLLPIDVEYPAFSRDMCSLLRELHAQGKKIHQVEPFTETLLTIHEFFAEGHKPDDVSENSIHYYVYRAERAATGALLAYYQTVGTGTFEEALDAIIRFARADAARFRLRDSLRAQALVSLVQAYPSSYIESGLIHYQLWRLLRDRLPPHVQVQPLFLADAALRSMGEKGHLYGPGDQLTLLYIFHPTISQPGWEKLLAVIDDLFENFRKTRVGRGGRNISAPSRRTRLHLSRATTLNRRLSPFVSADSARKQLGSTSTCGSIWGRV